MKEIEGFGDRWMAVVPLTGLFPLKGETENTSYSACLAGSLAPRKLRLLRVVLMFTQEGWEESFSVR